MTLQAAPSCILNSKMEPLLETIRTGFDQLVQFISNLDGSITNQDKLLTIISLAGGGILLFFGRRLYWFVIASAGFAGGILIGHKVFPPEPVWLILAAPVLIGIIVAILSIFLQKLALRVTGMLAGGFLGYTIAAELIARPWPLVGLLIGSIIGFWLVMILFDWALIMLSSLSGTALICQQAPLDREPRFILAAVLLLLGIAVQGTMQRKAPEAKTKDSG